MILILNQINVEKNQLKKEIKQFGLTYQTHNPDHETGITL
jgi:hypothetical protein